MRRLSDFSKLPELCCPNVPHYIHEYVEVTVLVVSCLLFAHRSSCNSGQRTDDGQGTLRNEMNGRTIVTLWSHLASMNPAPTIDGKKTTSQVPQFPSLRLASIRSCNIAHTSCSRSHRRSWPHLITTLMTTGIVLHLNEINLFCAFGRLAASCAIIIRDSLTNAYLTEIPRGRDSIVTKESGESFHSRKERAALAYHPRREEVSWLCRYCFQGGVSG